MLEHDIKPKADEVIIRYGTGCSAWPDCFTCPFKDCIADYSGGYRHHYSMNHQVKTESVNHQNRHQD